MRDSLRLPLVQLLLVCLCISPVGALADDQPSLEISSDLPAEISANIEAMSNLSKQACHPNAAQEALIHHQLQENTRLALRAMGYFDAEILQRWQRPDDDCFVVTLAVTLGRPVIITSVNISLQGGAARDNAFLALKRKAQQLQGKRLEQNRYDELKQKLQQLLINRGYLDGTLDVHRLEVNRQQHSARFVLQVTSGKRYRFGKITFSGDPRIDEELLRGYLAFSSGDYFSNQALLETQQNYQGSGYFGTVRIERTKASQQQLTLDIDFHFTSRKPWTLLAGVGISTDTGPRVRLGVKNRRINSHGHKLRLEAKASRVEKGVGGAYQIPVGDPRYERVSLHGRYLRTDTVSQHSRIGSIGVDYIIQGSNGWVTTPSIELLNEDYNIASEEDNVFLVIPGLKLTRVKADNRLHPHKGWKLGFKVQGASQSFLSSSDFLQYETWAKLILPVPLIGGRFISRGKVGVTLVSDVTALPASLRYFAGGDSSVRGFAYQSLGPLDANGEVIGGRNLLTGSVEYEHRLPFTKNWFLAVFTDAGNAFNNFDDYDIKQGIGAGIRWLSPIGPIRLDFARDVHTNRSWRLHLSMGPDL